MLYFVGCSKADPDIIRLTQVTTEFYKLPNELIQNRIHYGIFFTTDSVYLKAVYEH